jgi:PAS domain S-box-containing protein
MSSTGPITSNDHEALLQFVYMAPVGIAEISIHGEILMANPVAAQLLLPLSRDASLTNLFTVLEQVSPDLRTLVSGFHRANGIVCDAMRIQLGASARRKSAPQVFALTLVKLDDRRLMSVISDITEQVKRERALRHNEAWLSAMLTDITDYALVSLDDKGCVRDWNASIGRVTGYEPDGVLGRPYSIFYPPGGTTPERLLERLHEADENGWSLDDGWRQKADGSRFWGNALITPLHALEGAGTQGDCPAYCLVIRDITDKFEAGESIGGDTACDYLTDLAKRRAV